MLDKTHHNINQLLTFLQLKIYCYYNTPSKIFPYSRYARISVEAAECLKPHFRFNRDQRALRMR